MTLAEPLRQTLVDVAELGLSALDPWWVISGAAVALHGAPINDVGDVDLLMSRRDARQALARVGVVARTGSASRLFRSAIFGTWHGSALPVDIFGDFDFAGPGGWSRFVPSSREPVAIDDHLLFVPSAAELRQMLVGFGRPKDLVRARLLPAG